MASRGGQSTPAQAPKHIYDLTKALASEVRGLLDEVGELRERRRMLQFEIAEIMRMKSSNMGGGDYMPPGPEWHPHMIEGPPGMMMMGMPQEPPPPPMEPPPPAEPARGGWTKVYTKPERKKKQPKAIAAPPGPAAPPPPPPEIPAWQNWQPNPLIAPSPAMGASPFRNSPPPRQGLFGPATPPPS